MGSILQGKNLLLGANSFLEEVTLLRREPKRGKILGLLHLKVYPFTIIVIFTVADSLLLMP